MKRISLLLIFNFFCVLTVICQLPLKPWKPIVFKEVKPKWQTTLFDQAALSDSTDGYNRLGSWFNEYVIIDNSIITYSYIASPQDIEGGYIQRTDLETGNVIWKNRFDYHTDGEQKAIKRIFLNENNNLEIIGQKSLDSFSTNRWIPFVIKDENTVLFRKVFDVENGNLVLDYEADKDAGALVMTYSYVNGSAQTYLFNEKNHIAYFRNPLKSGKQALQLVKLDKEGKQFHVSDTLNYSGLVRNIIKDDSVFFTISSFQQKVLFQFFDSNFNKLDSISLSPEIGVENLSIVNVDPIKKTIVLSTQTFNESSIDSFYIYSIYVCNFEGEILNSAKFYTYKSTIFSIYLHENDIYILNSELRGDLENFTSSMVIRKSNSQHAFDEIYNFVIEDHEKIPLVSNLTTNNNGDLILLIDETSITKTSNSSYTFDRNANALTMICLNKDSIPLFFPNSLNNEITNESPISVFPNPTSDIFKIESTQIINSIKIFKIDGTMVINQNQLSDSNYIDLKNQPSGIYIMQCTTDNNKNITKIIVKK